MRWMFHEALELREQGFSVVPIVRGTKAPPKDFPLKEFFTRRPTLGEIRQWFSRESRNGIAVATGRISGIAVIDVESVEAARELYKKLPKTPAIALTGRGVHFYYQTQAAIPTRIKAKVQGVPADVKGEGGYVLAPPTMHPNGKKYEWVKRNWNLIDVPRFNPVWIDPGPVSTFRTCSPVLQGRVSDGAAYIALIRSVSGQGGHNAAFRATCALRDSGMSPADALAALEAWNETNCDPPWTHKQLEHKVISAYTSRQSGCSESGS